MCEEAKNEIAIQKRKQFEASLADNANIWGYSQMGVEAKKAAMTMLSTKHGLYASVPIICKAEKCPYCSSCKLLEYGLAPETEPCPMEVAQIESRYLAYNDEFGLEQSSFTDSVIVNEIIETEIMLERCKRLISEEMLPIQEVPISVSENGDVVTAPQVSKTIELNERLSKKHLNLLNMMRATRKDKVDKAEHAESLADVLAKAIQQEESDQFIIDVKPEHIE